MRPVHVAPGLQAVRTTSLDMIGLFRYPILGAPRQAARTAGCRRPAFWRNELFREIRMKSVVHRSDNDAWGASARGPGRVGRPGTRLAEQTHQAMRSSAHGHLPVG